ncbi:hypothetical protein G7009_16335 [Pseudomonas capeferrum]|uniref:hypothetical protein n=1 Tax=Pseudomonas capeferrum TaxID=1495066 RepID=UPI0015E45E67|nr:hypothetical protein [Pseudomonas capeferrum]MBA1203301.1 hypothetical protein [Pseudomonas capeferrum]
MSSHIHDQAIQYIFQQVLQRLLKHMSHAQRASLQLLIKRLVNAAGGPDALGGFTLLVLDSGDRSSAHTLACLRAAQLNLATRLQHTFNLRVVAVPSPGRYVEAMHHHEHCFNALFLHDDPRVRLLMASDGELRPFCAQWPASAQQPTRERDALLMFGHLCKGSPNDLFGSRRLLSLAEGYALALAGVDEVDAFVTGVPARHRRRQLAWSRRCLQALGLAVARSRPFCERSLADSLIRARTLLPWAGATREGPGNARSAGASGKAALHVVAIDDLLVDVQRDDWLERMLGPLETVHGWRLATFARDPVPLAHLHGLRAKLIEQRTYEEGVRYLRATLPRALWEEGGLQSDAVHKQAEAHFRQGYGLEDTQLACLLFTPFSMHGRKLDAYLQACHPSMRVAVPYMHKALRGERCPKAVGQWLTDTSGLSLPHLQRLYADPRLPITWQRLLTLLTRRDAELHYVSPSARSRGRSSSRRTAS